MWNFFPEKLRAFKLILFRYNSKDVSLPTQLQRAMATEAEAARWGLFLNNETNSTAKFHLNLINREARAKVIAAEGEMKSARALKEAADTMCESPAALQLRYLQVRLF